jgi:hypothetical protein
MDLLKTTRNTFTPSFFVKLPDASKEEYDFLPFLLVQKIKILNVLQLHDSSGLSSLGNDATHRKSQLFGNQLSLKPFKDIQKWP